MLLKIALASMVIWAGLIVLGLDRIGSAVHVLLLVGMMLTLLAFVKARDAARVNESETSKPPRER